MLLWSSWSFLSCLIHSPSLAAVFFPSSSFSFPFTLQANSTSHFNSIQEANSQENQKEKEEPGEGGFIHQHQPRIQMNDLAAACFPLSLCPSLPLIGLSVFHPLLSFFALLPFLTSPKSLSSSLSLPSPSSSYERGRERPDHTTRLGSARVSSSSLFSPHQRIPILISSSVHLGLSFFAFLVLLSFSFFVHLYSRNVLSPLKSFPGPVQTTLRPMNGRRTQCSLNASRQCFPFSTPIIFHAN